MKFEPWRGGGGGGGRGGVGVTSKKGGSAQKTGKTRGNHGKNAKRTKKGPRLGDGNTESSVPGIVTGSKTRAREGTCSRGGGKIYGKSGTDHRRRGGCAAVYKR